MTSLEEINAKLIEENTELQTQIRELEDKIEYLEFDLKFKAEKDKSLDKSTRELEKLRKRFESEITEIITVSQGKEKKYQERFSKAESELDQIYTQSVSKMKLTVSSLEKERDLYRSRSEKVPF